MVHLVAARSAIIAYVLRNPIKFKRSWNGSRRFYSTGESPHRISHKSFTREVARNAQEAQAKRIAHDTKSGLPNSADLSKAHACEECIGYTFKDPMILWEALQWPSNKSSSLRSALVGDKVLDLLIAQTWYSSLQSRGESPFLETYHGS